MMSSEGVLGAQALASGVMCGIIWFVQAVHYPLFAAVPDAHRAEYARLNRFSTAWVVLPPMIIEAVTAVWLAIWPPAAVGRTAAIVGVVLVAVLWLSTLTVQMPLHLQLERQGSTQVVVSQLVRGNWLRTILWTARAVLACWMVARCGR